MKGKNQLTKFRKNFLDASLFYPSIESSKNEAIQVKVKRSHKQLQFIEDALKIIQDIVNGVNKVVKGYCNSSAIKYARLYQLTGEVNALLREYPDVKKLQVLHPHISYSLLHCFLGAFSLYLFHVLFIFPLIR